MAPLAWAVCRPTARCPNVRRLLPIFQRPSAPLETTCPMWTGCPTVGTRFRDRTGKPVPITSRVVQRLTLRRGPRWGRARSGARSAVGPFPMRRKRLLVYRPGRARSKRSGVFRPERSPTIGRLGERQEVFFFPPAPASRFSASPEPFTYALSQGNRQELFSTTLGRLVLECVKTIGVPAVRCAVSVVVHAVVARGCT